MNKSLKTFKYRIYPNKEQVQTLQWTLDRCRELYNAALDERKSVMRRGIPWKNYGNGVVAVEAEETEKRDGTPIAHFKRQSVRTGPSVTKFSQSRELTEIKHDIRPEYQQINDHILRNVLERVDLAFDAFFRRCKEGTTPGYPRFQGAGRYNSFSSDGGYKLVPGQDRKNAKLTIQNVGEINVQYHRPMEGKPKRYTVRREKEQWFVTIVCEVVSEELPISYEDVGIDLGVTHFAALSDGSFIDNPRYYRKGEKVLERRQQALSRKKRGSNRRKKAVQLVSRAHHKVRNQRKDFLHKQSRALVDKHQVIVFEDLQTANLVKRPKPKQDENGKYLPNGASAKAGLNKSISDAGWAEFVQYCSYKAECAGRAVVNVNPRYTSQICSGCGSVMRKDLSERWHSCECGTELDRDTNAAINILRLGQQHLRGA